MKRLASMFMISGVGRQVGVIATLVAMLALNLGTRDDPTDLARQGREGVFARYPNAFAPHPFTFAIWLPIFAGAIAFTVYQALPTRRTSEVLDRVGRWIAVGYALVALTAVVGLGSSNIVVALAAVAIIMALRAAHALGRGATRWLVRAPIGLFAGWLIVATTLNLCQLAVAFGVGVPPVAAAGLMMLAAVGALVLLRRCAEPAVAIAIIWATSGIVAARPDQPWIWVGSAVTVLMLGSQLGVVPVRGRSD